MQSAGLPEMDVQIDQPRDYGTARRVYDAHAARHIYALDGARVAFRRLNFRDFTVFDEYVRFLVAPQYRVDHATAAYQYPA
jgi:hypothetical protein